MLQLVIRISSLFRHLAAATCRDGRLARRERFGEAGSGSRRDVSQTRRIVIRHYKPTCTALYYCCIIISLIFPTITLASGTYSGGTGDPNTPFQIAEPNDLIEMSQHAEDWSEHFILTADINLNLAEPNTFTTALIAPDITIGYPFDGTPFTGTFDGQNHTIQNLAIDTAGVSNDYFGMFGQTESGAVIQNIGLKNVNITGSDDSDYLGGLVGKNMNSTIKNCYATGSVTGDDYLGGLVGYNWRGTISNCYATGSITGGDYSKYLGGLVGSNIDGTISNCYATGSVTGGDHSQYLGGLAGSNSCTINHCFWDVDTSGMTSSSGGVGLHTPQMQKMSTYYAWGIGDDQGVWTIDNGNNYPHLTWENQPGIPISSPDLPDILDGSGNPNDPYLIYTAQQLAIIGYYPGQFDKLYKLMSDINMNLAEPNSFATALIAPDTSNSYGFQGTTFIGNFDGNDHSIQHITINTYGDSKSYLGLFGKIEPNAIVQDLSLENVNIIGGIYSGYLGNSEYLGGLVGFNEGAITNCYTNGSVTGGDLSRYLGGLVGTNFGTISNCYTAGFVKSGYSSGRIGGLVGSNGDNLSSHVGTINNCYAVCSVTGGRDSICLGGLVGGNYFSNINNCYTSGSVTGGIASHYLGGLVGRNYYSTISNCNASSSINGDIYSFYLGGLVGRNEGSTISNCYANGSVTGRINSEALGGLVGTSDSLSTISNSYFLDAAGPDNGYGEPLDDPNMQIQSNFVGWDFVDSGPEEIWRMGFMPPRYPILYFQRDIPGDFTGEYGVDLADYAFLANFWADTNCTPSNNHCSGADLDLSGEVDIHDLMLQLSHWLDGK